MGLERRVDRLERRPPDAHRWCPHHVLGPPIVRYPGEPEPELLEPCPECGRNRLEIVIEMPSPRDEGGPSHGIVRIPGRLG